MITGAAVILLLVIVAVNLWFVTLARKHQDNIEALEAEHHSLCTKLADVEAELRVFKRLRK